MATGQKQENSTMPRVIEKTVFRFDELAERAKENARDWFRAWDDFDAEHIVDDFANICELMGVNIRQKPVKLMNGSTRFDPAVYWSGFGHQGQGASFEGSYSYKPGTLKAIKAYAPTDKKLHRIAADLQAVQRKAFYSLSASISTSGRDGLSMRADVNDDRTDDDATEEQSDAVSEAMTDLAHWLFCALRDEYEYRNSDENVDECIRINEYEFDEDGHII